MKQHITKKQGTTYIDEEGFLLMKAYKDELDDIKSERMDNTTDAETATDSTDLSLRSDYISLLKEQLKKKDEQLQNYSDRLAQSQKLVENSQILQLKQPQNIEALEEHFVILDEKLEKVKENMEMRKEKSKPKGFLSNLFNKK